MAMKPLVVKWVGQVAPGLEGTLTGGPAMISGVITGDISGNL